METHCTRCKPAFNDDSPRKIQDVKKNHKKSVKRRDRRKWTVIRRGTTLLYTVRLLLWCYVAHTLSFIEPSHWNIAVKDELERTTEQFVPRLFVSFLRKPCVCLSVYARLSFLSHPVKAPQPSRPSCGCMAAEKGHAVLGCAYRSHRGDRQAMTRPEASKRFFFLGECWFQLSEANLIGFLEFDLNGKSW